MIVRTLLPPNVLGRSFPAASCRLPGENLITVCRRASLGHQRVLAVIVRRLPRVPAVIGRHGRSSGGGRPFLPACPCCNGETSALETPDRGAAFKGVSPKPCRCPSFARHQRLARIESRDGKRLPTAVAETEQRAAV